MLSGHPDDLLILAAALQHAGEEVERRHRELVQGMVEGVAAALGGKAKVVWQPKPPSPPPEFDEEGG